MNNELENIYAGMNKPTTVVTESKESKTVVAEKDATKASMTVGDVKPGDLKGKTKEIQPGTGPAVADGVKKAEEAPESLSPVKARKNVKENNMSFQNLYNQVMVKEENIEGANYDEDINDFPPSSDEAGADMEPVSDEEVLGGERSEVDILQELKGLIDELIALKGGATDETGLDADVGADVGAEAGAGPMGEAVSQPEPKEFKANISALQKRKLGGAGVKVVRGKGALSAGAKKRTGEIEIAPKGVKPGDKSFMKVGGSGPAATGKNASMLES